MAIDRFQLVRHIDDERSLVRNKQMRNAKRLLILRCINSSAFTELERQSFVSSLFTQNL